METLPLIVLAGPTAVGKTALSIALAKAVGGEIISCDSMQVYKYMDIGSAKITPEEMQGVPHYLVDVLEPDEEFHVAKFVSMAKEAMQEIYAKGHIPIAVGGTGFYIQALLYDTDFTEEEKDDAYRQELEDYAATYGNEALFQKLREVDPASCLTIHPNNRKRVIRALEYYKLHQSPISAHNEQQHQKTSPYNFCYFVLNDDREKLYAGIDKRVDAMMEQGLWQEVQQLYDRGYRKDMVSMQGLGYKELLDVVTGEDTLEHAIYKIKRDTRHFAKRQLTWFRSKEEVIWINKPEFDYDPEKILAFMEDRLQENKITVRG
jgi:tRNA dimethylallyltransferase